MNNEEFLTKIKEAFYKYLYTGSGSNEKLKILHGAIANDLEQRLGENFDIHSLGYKDNREIEIAGRYMDKRVDIGIKKGKEVIGAIALKFIMRNYSQNSNNYFENMLGETSNIRLEGKPYFQIVILPSRVPYFKSKGEISKIETITEHNLSKYIKLSNDCIDDFMHIPNKILIYLVDIPDFPSSVKDNQQYIDYYINNNDFKVVENEKIYGFGDVVIYNDYNKFINEVVNVIKA